MIVGVPREVKEGERRVALLPAAVAELTGAGHDVLVETRAGRGVGIDDDAYRDAGAGIVAARDAWQAELVVKVKEMQPADIALLPPGASLFSYQHLTSHPERTRELAAKALTAIAWEEMRDARGRFPLLAPMSRIAGRMSIDVAREALGRVPERVLVLGAGEASLAAASAALARGAHVTVLARSERSREAARALGAAVESLGPGSIEREALAADLVVAAVFAPDQPTPRLLPRELVRRMKRGAMILDISIEEGGVAETSRRTTHAEPTYVDEGVVHYCVGNMPAARPVEASAALSAAAAPYVLDLARAGIAAALGANAELRSGLLLWKGRVAHPGIAREAGLPYAAPTDAELREAAAEDA